MLGWSRGRELSTVIVKGHMGRVASVDLTWWKSYYLIIAYIALVGAFVREGHFDLRK